MERLRLSVHFSFYLLLVSAVVFRRGYLLAMYTLAMLLHECAHYIVATNRRYKCNNMQLSAFGAVLYGKFDQVNPTDSIAIALAGPCTNVIVAVICLALWWIFPASYVFTETFFSANISMAFVNMLPCYPLDGGRVIVALWDKSGKDGYRNARKLTVAVALTLFAVFVISVAAGYNLFSMGLFAVFLFSSLIGKNNVSYKRIAPFVLNERATLGMEVRTLMFCQDVELNTVFRRMQGGFLYNVEVVDEHFNVVARLSPVQLQYAALHFPSNTTLKETLELLSVNR